jgi:hypothetical protein
VAVITVTELAYLRQQFVGLGTATVTKPQINAAMQAIEDTLLDYVLQAGDAGQTVQQLVSTAINAATQPLGVTFTAPQKKLLFAYWANVKYLRDKA